MSHFINLLMKQNVVHLSELEIEILVKSGTDTAYSFIAAESEEQFCDEMLTFVKEEFESIDAMPANYCANTFQFSYATKKRFQLMVRYTKERGLDYFVEILSPPTSSTTTRRPRRNSSSNNNENVSTPLTPPLTPSPVSTQPQPVSVPPPPIPNEVELETIRMDFLRWMRNQFSTHIADSVPIQAAFETNDENKVSFRVTCPICNLMIRPYFGYHQRRYQVVPSSVKRHYLRKHTHTVEPIEDVEETNDQNEQMEE